MESSRSFAELSRDLSEQTAMLVRKELALATAEIKEKGKHVGVGAGLFGGAGVIGFYAVGALIATAILALSELVTPWLAALIVTVLLLAAAAAAALVGKREVDQGTPPKPERAMHETSVDVESVREAARRGTSREVSSDGR
jgi:hypothetical protein